MSDDLIYTPAKRGNVGVLIMLAGPSGSGKTRSALRLAVGLANGGTIGFCDTEHGRALYYADDVEFMHLELKEPFNPKRFEDAAVMSQKLGHAVWICDSFSHEHIGPGGVLDMQEAELQRMTKGDFSKREVLKYASWIAPKMEHKHMLQRLWQLNAHIIICCHGEKKLELIKDSRGKTVPNPDAVPSPVCAPDIPFAMTCSFMLDAKRPGVPQWLKRLDKLDGMIDLDRPLDEATGARIGAWARGEKAPAVPARGDAKNAAVRDELVNLFNGITSRAEHLVIVDQEVNRQKLDWFRKNRPEMFEEINRAIVASWNRSDAEDEPATDDAPADTDPAKEGADLSLEEAES